MKCEDCIHLDVCGNFYEIYKIVGTKDIVRMIDYNCEDYIPKSDYAEVKHGKWIHKVKKYLYQPDSCTAICSVCGSTYGLDPEYTIKWFAKDNKFCSHCGAKMDGRRKDDDKS